MRKILRSQSVCILIEIIWSLDTFTGFILMTLVSIYLFKVSSRTMFQVCSKLLRPFLQSFHCWLSTSKCWLGLELHFNIEYIIFRVLLYWFCSNFISILLRKKKVHIMSVNVCFSWRYYDSKHPQDGDNFVFDWLCTLVSFLDFSYLNSFGERDFYSFVDLPYLNFNIKYNYIGLWGK